MTYEDLNKDNQIKFIVKHLMDTFGQENFKIMDHWEADLCAIGLSDIREEHLVYISTYNDRGYFASLEILHASEEHPYTTVGDYNQLDLNELEDIFAKHLKLEKLHS